MVSAQQHRPLKEDLSETIKVAPISEMLTIRELARGPERTGALGGVNSAFWRQVVLLAPKEGKQFGEVLCP